jgi:glycosyltransferase involved in cell wall biosynthesis
MNLQQPQDTASSAVHEVGNAPCRVRRGGAAWYVAGEFDADPGREVYVIAHNASPDWGGGPAATALLLSGLQERGHRVKLYCGAPLVVERARRLGLAAVHQPLGGDGALPHALRFAHALHRERPDVLLAGTFKKLWLVALGGRLAGIPTIVARIGLETDTPRNWKYRAVLERWVDVVVVCADRIRPHYLSLPGWTEERIATIYNGVRQPSRTQEPGAVRRSLGLGPQHRVIGTVARLVDQKRQDRLLHALAALPADVHCILAGDGDMRKPLERLGRQLALDSRLHFLGHRDDVGDVLDAMDVFVICSDLEGMSNAMLEALAAGVPVISTPVSGAAEALRPLPGGTAPGEIVEFSSEALAAALDRLLRDPERRRAMAEAAVQHARTRFDFDRMVDEWERVLAGHRRSPTAGVVSRSDALSPMAPAAPDTG